MKSLSTPALRNIGTPNLGTPNLYIRPVKGAVQISYDASRKGGKQNRYTGVI